MLTRSVLLLALLSAAFVPLAQTVTGKLIVEQGSTYLFDVELNNTVAQQAMGQSIDFKVNGKATHTYKVTNVSDDYITFHHEAQRMSFVFDGMGNKKCFDSENKKDQGGQLGGPVKAMLEKKYDMLINTGGTVMKVSPEKFPPVQMDDRISIVFNLLKDLTSVTEPPKKGEASAFGILPARELKTGDTWTTELTSEGERSTTVYTLSAIGDSTIGVEFVTTGTSSFKATVMGMETSTALKNATKGTMILDKTTQVMQDKTSVTDSMGTTEIMGNTTPVTAKTSIHVRVSRQ